MAKNERKSAGGLRSREEIAAIVAEFRRSGMSRRAFASARGLNYWTFSGWIKRAGKKRRQGIQHPAVIPVRVRVAQAAPAAGALEVRLAQGRSIRIEGDFDEAVLLRLVRVLEAQC